MVNSEVRPYEVDDGVLDCAQYFVEMVAPGYTELLTNDRRLCIKAASRGIPTERTLNLLERSMAASVYAEMPMGVPVPPPPPPAVEVPPGLEEVFGADPVEVPQIWGIPLPAPPGLDGDKDSDSAGSTRSHSRDGEVTTEGSNSPDRNMESPLGEPNEAPDCEANLSLPPSAYEEHNKGKIKVGACREGPFVVLRGLPFDVTEQQVLAFAEKAGVARNDLAPDSSVVLLTNSQGRASGFAEVHLAEGVDLWTVRKSLHMQHLGGRYIEALPPKQARKAAMRTGAQHR
jgi:hypothetical protein